MTDLLSHERVNSGGVALHMATAGPAEGEPIILLHGFPEFWWGWRRQIDGLARAGFAVIAPDLRGFGQSDAPQAVSDYQLDKLVADIIAIADARKLVRFNLVGHDWGGIIAFAVAARHPSRVERLAILNAPHLDVVRDFIRRHPPQLLRSAYVGFFQVPSLSEGMLSLGNFALLERALTQTSRRGTFSREDLARYAAEWRRPGRLTAMLNYYRALVRYRRAPLGKIAPPTLILWGERDAALSFGLAEASLQCCENGRLERFPEATHWLHLEQPDDVLAAIVAFCGETA